MPQTRRCRPGCGDINAGWRGKPSAPGGAVLRPHPGTGNLPQCPLRRPGFKIRHLQPIASWRTTTKWSFPRIRAPGTGSEAPPGAPKSLRKSRSNGKLTQAKPRDFRTRPGAIGAMSFLQALRHQDIALPMHTTRHVLLAADQTESWSKPGRVIFEPGRGQSGRCLSCKSSVIKILPCPCTRQDMCCLQSCGEGEPQDPGAIDRRVWLVDTS